MSKIEKDEGLNIYLLDPGARGHAMARKIIASEKVDTLYTSISAVAEDPNKEKVQTYWYNKKDPVQEAVDFTKENEVDLVVVGPENPLSNGIVDVFSKLGIPIFGPIKEHAFLEADKARAKDFMDRHGIPIPYYEIFTDYDRAEHYIKSKEEPLVVKAAGLAAGKGSIVCSDEKQALQALHTHMIKKKFGEAGEKVVIEDRLFGIEQSAMMVTDGETVFLLPTARDYKQREDGDRGLNTGGMGSHSPSFNEGIFSQKEILEQIFLPALKGIREETGKPYKGVLYAGLMWVKKGEIWQPYVLEFNIRLGDPEAQVILPRLEADFVDVLISAVNGDLKDVDNEFLPDNYLTVCAVSGAVPKDKSKGKGRFPGYPGRYKSNRKVALNRKAIEKTDGYLLHSGTRWVCEHSKTRHFTPCDNGEYLTTGGRVFSAVGRGEDLNTARNNAYEILQQGVVFDYMDYRKDIGNPKLLENHYGS